MTWSNPLGLLLVFNNIINSLPFRVASVIVITALGIAVVISTLVYHRTVYIVTDDLKTGVDGLVRTVEHSAAIAAFASNEEIALEVVRGLSGNQIIHGVVFQNSDVLKVSAGEPFSKNENNIQVYQLPSPFIPGETVGTLLIKTNEVFIADVASESAWLNVVALAVQAVVIMIAVIIQVHFVVIKPLLAVGGSLHLIEPGGPDTLSCPPRHEQSVIGVLVGDTNKLLQSVRNTLEGERRLRQFIEAEEQKTRHEAERDPLTHLYNRRAGERLTQRALEASQRDNQQMGVMLIDLDGFKPINDTHGHEAGDKVLVVVAERLIELLRQSDVVIRWGGDEFLVVAQQDPARANLLKVGATIIERLSSPILLDSGETVQIGASIGVSVYPNDAETLDLLIERADQAMYHVKRAGKNDVVFYASLSG